MKTIIHLLVAFTSINLFSQAIPDYTLAAFGLSKDVVKCEEKSYSYNSVTNSFDLDMLTVMTFQNGKLITKKVEDLGLFKYNTQTDYTYNSSGQIQKEYSKSTYSSGDPVVESKIYTYTGSKLTSVLKDSYSKTTTVYFYDAGGKLLKSETKKEDGKLEMIEEFSNVIDSKNYNKKTLYYYNTDGSVSNNNTEVYVNGKYISFNSQSKDYGDSSYEYTYDKYGNILTGTEDFLEVEKNIYEYDAYGNWIKCKSYQDDWLSGIRDDYKFRKITLKNGSSGDASFDQNFVNKYPSDVNKQNTDTSTNPSTSVITPNTTKKSATNPGCEGNCQDGYGTYYYSDGNVYEGFFKDGTRNGPGILTFSGGDTYIGNWVNGLKDGYALYKWSSGAAYIGYYKNDKLNGEGMYLNEKNEIKGGVLKDGNFDVTYNYYDNGVTTGCIAGDCENGFGKYAYSNGDLFMGFFINGYLKHGMYSYANKDIFFGEFKNGSRDGLGYYEWNDKNSYLGMYQNGTYHGLGYYYVEKDATQDQIGEFRNGSLYKSMK